jgi:hypothetical protein
VNRAATAVICTILATICHAECPKASSAVQEYKQSDAVVIATVESSHPIPQSWDALDGTNFVVHIDQKVKGKQSGDMTLFSEHSEDQFPLEVGKQYLLFLSSNYSRWQVNKCGNSGVLDQEGAVIKELAHMMGNDN